MVSKVFCLLLSWFIVVSIAPLVDLSSLFIHQPILLYVIDKEARRLYIMDPIQTSQSLEEKNLRHALKLKSFARDFKEALEIKLPGFRYI